MIGSILMLDQEPSTSQLYNNDRALEEAAILEDKPTSVCLSRETGQQIFDNLGLAVSSNWIWMAEKSDFNGEVELLSDQTESGMEIQGNKPPDLRFHLEDDGKHLWWLPQPSWPSPPREILEVLAQTTPPPEPLPVFTQLPFGQSPSDSRTELQETPPPEPENQQAKLSKAKNISNIFIKRVENIMVLYLAPSRTDLLGLLNCKGTSIQKSRTLLLNHEINALVQLKFSNQWNKFLKELEKKKSTEISRYKEFLGKMWEFIDSPEEFKEWLPRPVGVKRAQKMAQQNLQNGINL